MNRILSSIRGVYVVWLRHFCTYKNSLVIGILALIYEPLLFLLAFGGGIGSLVGQLEYFGQSIPYINFFAPGMIALACLQQSLYDAAYNSFAAMHYTKLWQSRLTSPLTFNQILLGDLSWTVTKAMLTANIIGILSVLCNALTFKLLLLFQPILLLGAVLMGSIGLIIAGLSNTDQHLFHTLHFIMTPMMLLGGTFYPRTGYPPIADILITVLPIAPVTDLLRSHMGASHFEIKLLWLVLFTATNLMLGRRMIYKRIYGV